jgi:hypothetical protein
MEPHEQSFFVPLTDTPVGFDQAVSLPRLTSANASARVVFSFLCGAVVRSPAPVDVGAPFLPRPVASGPEFVEEGDQFVDDGRSFRLWRDIGGD